MFCSHIAILIASTTYLIFNIKEYMARHMPVLLLPELIRVFSHQQEYVYDDV